MSDLLRVAPKLDPKTHEEFKRICDENHRTMAATAAMLIEKYVEENTPPTTAERQKDRLCL